ncbi:MULTISPECIES: aminotransferase family protein [Bacillaceae]|uniref:aminotransferase family protein n=1 Tax=Bacillaceae TaxID=186817 RepID=UPI000BFC52C3|nr:aspartate aminotransferase family protein [Bacillus sp. AFS031507]PGY13003.1 aspartate aminotransferase family protein [Bacillus sp. AFS031507]
MLTLSQDIKKLSELDKKHYLHPSSSPLLQVQQGPKLIFSEGKGVRVTDIKGDTYIDGVSMLWNVNVGHGEKELADAAHEQMSKLAFGSSFFGFSNEPAIRLAEKVAQIAPGDLNSIFYTSGGSESNDTAVKLARFYWSLKGKSQKLKVISLKNGYHGVTIGAQTLTGIEPFTVFSGSKQYDVVHAAPHLTNCELGDKTDPNYENSIRAAIEREGAETIAAVIIEPVQGAGGVHVSPTGYLQAVRKLCDENEVLFIADEVICAFGRTGTMFGVENWDVVPDFMSVAKGITSGYAQLGGVLIRDHIKEEISQYPGALAHGFTYSGHPTACAVGLKNIELIERYNLVANTKNMEQELMNGLKYLEIKHSIVTNTRGIGLLAAFDLMADRDNGVPFDPTLMAAYQVCEEAFKRKLLVRGSGNSLIISPPLVINKNEIEEMISIFDDSITAFKKTL